ncbi:DUF1761 domain-containing protein [Candidatus Saccharibacteria bacterium]|jgi:hypothetical protein|nr:DUF1761 domain-containing protein [Candidatus Saccharibacteria bacterium]MBP9131786.1 DUF1761 domain-containing protein [Candidatus Saccharibacteria bacterium]
MINTLASSFSDVSWLSIALATISTFMIGSIWYHEKVIGSCWMRQVPLKRKDIESSNMIIVFSLSTVAVLISSIALAILANALKINNVFEGTLLGGLVGFFFLSTATASNYIFQKRSLKLLVIDASFMTITFATMGAVIGAF